MGFIYFPVFVSVLSHLHYYPCFHLSSPTEEEREVLLSCFTSSVFPTTTTLQKCVHMSINGLFFYPLLPRRENISERDPHPQKLRTVGFVQLLLRHVTSLLLPFSSVCPSPWVDFINVFTRSFYARRSRKHKKQLEMTVFFALLGSLSLKAPGKMLVKLTPCLSQLCNHIQLPCFSLFPSTHKPTVTTTINSEH